MPPRDFAQAARRPGRGRSRGSRPSTSPDPASSTSPSTPPPPARSPRSDRRGRGRRTAARRLRRRASINLEFVSANPTGPLHLGDTRWAAVGDALARVLRGLTGARSRREYYFNDHGAQIDRFAASLLAAAAGRAGPGGRLRRRSTSTTSPRTVARQRAPTSLDLPTAEAQAVFRAVGVDAHVRRDQAEPARLRRRLRRLLPEDRPARRRSRRAGGRAADASRATSTSEDGAVWLRTSEFGDDKDRVIIKSDGEPTYFVRRPRLLPRQAGARLRPLLYMLGADHHGYVGRLQGDVRVRSATTPSKNIEVLIGQMVNLVATAADADVQARRQRSSRCEDLVDGDRRRRHPLRAGPLPSRLARIDTRPRPAGPSRPTTTRSSTSSTPTPGPPTSILRNAADARRRPRGRLRPRPAHHPTEGEPCSARSASSPGSWPRPRELREPHRVARYLEDTRRRATTSSTTPAGCCRRATRRSPTCTAPGCCSTTRPGRCSPTASACSASPRPERM